MRGLRAMAKLGLLAAPLLASAHVGSTAYWQLQQNGSSVALRSDYALRDLDDALGLDADNDGAITWAEVQSAAPTVQRYLLQHLSLSADDARCTIEPVEPVQIAEHSDGPYAVFRYSAQCPVEPQTLALGDSALFEFDANHRGLVSLQRGDGSSTSGVLSPDSPVLRFTPAPSVFNTLVSYWFEGLHHVWSGWDHMLFLAGLFLAAALRWRGGLRTGHWEPVEKLGDALWPTVKLVTAFSIAHAVTLCMAALGVISPPSRLVETLVAFSVFFAGFNNLLPIASHRVLFFLAWGFGLIHGAAIASALKELGLPATGRVIALLGFNLGVETAQLTLVGTVVPIVVALRHWRGYVPLLLRPGSSVVALAGFIWMIDRAFAMHWPLPI